MRHFLLAAAILASGPRCVGSALPLPFAVAARNHPVMARSAADENEEAIRRGEKTFALSACAGEYEPVSALVYAAQAISGLTVSCSGLTSRQNTISSASVDVRIVKSWFQGNPRGIVYSAQKWLVPELLLKDDGLVKVDLSGKTNYLRSTEADGSYRYLVCSDQDSSDLGGARPRDARELQPLDMNAGEVREFWITVHVPEEAVSGAYEGAIFFGCREGSICVPIRLTVHSFVLLPPRLVYSLYYRGTLSADGQPAIGSESKSEEQYRAEMDDMKAHGVFFPTSYLGHDEKTLRRTLQIRDDVGLPKGAFYNLGFQVGCQSTGEIPAIQDEVRWWIETLTSYGYANVFFYGVDEAKGEALRLEKPSWQACHEAGGKIFVACYHGAFEATGNALDLAILAGALDSGEARKWHSVGSRVFCYANPQVGLEDPAIYRRNYGFTLISAGYDGEMDYAYQHGFNNIWDDFDHLGVRDHVFAYPTIDGVVDTIAWEGFREAVDDARYQTTLEDAIDRAPKEKKTLADRARDWLDGFRPETADPDSARGQMAAWIEVLR